MSKEIVTGQCKCRSENEEQKYAEIANVIDLYKGKEGSLIQILHLAQEIYGYLPLDLQTYIADQMKIPLSEVSGVVTFYSFFSTKPRGEHTIRVCLGTACYVRGGKKIVDALQKTLGVDVGGTTADGKFTCEVARCLGACGLAPVLTVNDKVYPAMTPDKASALLSALKEGLIR